MIKQWRCIRVLLFAASVNFCLVPGRSFGDAYDLGNVRGMEGFQGSSDARRILGRNGFVVADPSFKQIFEAYIKSPAVMAAPSDKRPMGDVLPSFITADSA
jgi:hypothetical protein